MLILGVQEEKVNTILSRTVENQGMGTNKVLKKEQGQLQATSKRVRNMKRDNKDRDQTTCQATARDVIQRKLLDTTNMDLNQDSLLAAVKKDLANIGLMIKKNMMYNQENHQVVAQVSQQSTVNITQGQAGHLARRKITWGQEILLV